MTADVDIFRRAGVDEARDEQARRAVLEGRKLLPTLTSYARNLTKNTSVQVVMATHDNGSTDGKKINWRPPMALGDRTPHERRFCDKRGDDSQLLCRACLVREDVLVVIYHEIAHIAFDSFAPVSDSDKVGLIQKAIESTGGKYAEAIKRRIESAPYWTKSSYISMASLVSEFLPLIFNALEDARVNREMFKARKGTKQMFDANCAKIFNEGVEQIDPLTGKAKVVLWYDYPLNLQVIVGLFAKASGYDYSTWFRPNVVEALNDRKLGDLVNQLATTRTAAGVYHLGFPVLARLRELGFCQLPDDPEPDPEPESEPEPDGEDTGGDSDSESQDHSSDESDSPDSDGEPENEGSDSSGPSSDDESADSDSGTGSSEEPDPTGSRGGADSDQDEDSDTGTGDGGAGADSDDTSEDAGSAPAEADGSDDEPTDPDSVGSGGEPEDLAEQDPASEDGSSSGAGSGPEDDSSGGEASEESEGEAESDGITGTGDIEGDRAEGERERDVDDSEEDDPSGAGSGSHRGDSGHDAAGDSDDDSADEPGAGSTSAQSDNSDEPAPSGGSDDSSDGDPEEGREQSDEPGDEEAIDSGADAGLGGTEIVEDSANDDLPMGTPEDAKAGLLKLGDHEPPKKMYEEKLDDEAIDRAIIQGMYFETPSRFIFGVREHRYNQPISIDGHNMSQAWDHSLYEATGYSKRSLGIEGDFDPPESVLGPALLRMRVAFSDNKRAHDQPHLKAGRVNGRVLGRRAWADDERLFRRRIQPGKRDYFVLIGMDISGSTVGTNIQLEKRAVMAQAELCARMGITFAIYGHSGNYHQPTGGRSNGLDLDIYLIKEANEPWNTEVKQRLREIGPDSANLDGHTLEYYRKVCDRRPETEKIIMYYTDGKMPAENHDEELMLLQREIRYCKQKRYVLLGVGVRTDSPVRHGLDTVQVDNDADVAKVVKHLEKRLSVHV